MDAAHSFRIEDGSVVRGKEVTIDLDGDGVREFLGGAEDGRMYYLKRKNAR